MKNFSKIFALACMAVAVELAALWSNANVLPAGGLHEFCIKARRLNRENKSAFPMLAKYLKSLATTETKKPSDAS